MTQRRPVCRIGGVLKELPLGDKPAGSWAKAISVPAGGTVSATIPAGFFAALPVIRHTIQATGTRDYVFRLSGLTLNADKTITVTGIVRESRTMPAVISLLSSLANYDPFQPATTALTLHLSAEESD
ncbi:hypothetical protein ABIE45_004518 [Methylobacterium sp. OAE515]|uniref:hypothetical protein n=1 Tax=Methylobacterium sp. OAE515 TaxID=2817895 RepID=UPI00178A2941